MTKIFLVSFDLQRDEISTYCFDSCGSISFGAIEVELYEGLPPMLFMPCVRAVCPFLDREVDESCFEKDGSTFHLRKLQDLSQITLPVDKIVQKAV
jgi:hypothetical protein